MFGFENFKIQEEPVSKTESFVDLRMFLIGFSTFICTIMSTFILGTLFNEFIHGRFSSPRRNTERSEKNEKSSKTILKKLKNGESKRQMIEETESEEKEEEIGEDVAEPEEEPVSEEGDGPVGDQASIKLELDQTTTQCDDTNATNVDSQGTSDASSIGSQIHVSETPNN